MIGYLFIVVCGISALIAYDVLKWFGRFVIEIITDKILGHWTIADEQERVDEALRAIQDNAERHGPPPFLDKDA